MINDTVRYVIQYIRELQKVFYFLFNSTYVCMCVLYQSVFGCSLPTLADNLALHLLTQLWYLILQGCVCVWGGLQSIPAILGHKQGTPWTGHQPHASVN